MSVNPELIERDPDLAEVIQQLLRFDRSFNLGDVPDQATFAEAVQELGRHTALNSSTGRISIDHGPMGITGVRIQVTPHG